MSGRSPAASPCTASNDSATVVGTGRSSRNRRCKHLARPPCVAGLIGASGVIKVMFGSFCCTAAPICCASQHRPAARRNKPLLFRRADFGLLAFDAGQVRRLKTDHANARQQVQTVAAHNIVVTVHLHRLEKCINRRAQRRHGPHRGGKVFGLDGGSNGTFGSIKRGKQSLFAIVFSKFYIRAIGVFHAVFFLGLAQDVIRAFEPLQQVLAVFGTNKILQRSRTCHQQCKVIIARHRNAGVDHVMAHALITQIDLKAVMEERKQVSRRIRQCLPQRVNVLWQFAVNGRFDRVHDCAQHTMLRDLLLQILGQCRRQFVVLRFMRLVTQKLTVEMRIQ
mmetsp:Transcript_28293/g.52614  ORF Transcript_28293/g.52614 Transcript_28293/m.52614 type:complete len:336 (-) Transcript_28293:2793-3800(-)